MPLVNVPGVGQLSFPDGMSQEDMAAAIRKNFPQIHGPAAAPAEATYDPMTGMSETPTQPGEAQGATAGLAEGGKRWRAGLKQIGADLEDAGRTFVSGTPSRTNGFVGGSQVLPSSASGQMTAQENARQATAQQAADQQGQPYGGAFRAGAEVGNQVLAAAPALATEGAIGAAKLGLGADTAAATTLGGNIARQAAVGGAAGGAAFSPTDDKATNAAVGAAGGAALGTVSGTVNAARNYVARAIKDTMQRSGDTYAAAAPVMQWGTDASAAAQGDPTLAMRTGNPTARSLEAQTFNARLQERYQKVSDYFATRFKDVFGLADQPAAVDADTFSTARQSADTAVKGMSRAASEAYDVGMSRAGALAAPSKSGAFGVTGAAPTVQAPDFASALTRLSAADSDRIGGSQVLPKDWTAAVQGALRDGNGTLTVQQTAGALRRLTGMMGDDQPLELRALAHQLRDSFDTDLDLMAKRGDTAHPAVQQLLDTRAQYKAAQQNIRTLQDSAAYKFLGVGPGESPDPATLTARYAALSPDRQAQVTTFMRNNSPQLLSQIRGKVLSDAVGARAQAAGPAAMSETDPSAIVDTLFDKGGVLKTNGLWTEAERAKFEGFRQAMRVINNVAQKERGGAGTLVQPADIAPNIVSRSGIFIARQIARIATGGGDAFFTSPDAVNLWTKIRSTSGPQQTAAIVGYANYLASQTAGNGQGKTAQ